MNDSNYRPNGKVQGDPTSIPKTNGSRKVGYSYSTYGADIGDSAINRKGEVSGTGSDGKAEQARGHKGV